jgi:cohesin complex subunit SA-1/2
MQDYLAPEIISHFVMHGAVVADIVKYLITFLKKREDDWVAIFLEALKKVIFFLDVGYYIK